MLLNIYILFTHWNGCYVVIPPKDDMGSVYNYDRFIKFFKNEVLWISEAEMLSPHKWTPGLKRLRLDLIIFASSLEMILICKKLIMVNFHCDMFERDEHFSWKRRFMSNMYSWMMLRLRCTLVYIFSSLSPYLSHKCKKYRIKGEKRGNPSEISAMMK